MNTHGNNCFRANNTSHSHGSRQLGQLLGENVETVFISHDDGNAGNAGLHITQVFPTPSSHANNYFFNNPGSYNISLINDVSSVRPQAQLGQLTRNVPTSCGNITPVISTGPFGLLGAGSAATLAQNQGGSTPATNTGNGNRGNEPTLSSSVERPAFARVSKAVTPNGPRTE